MFIFILATGCFDENPCPLPAENCHVYNENDFNVCAQFEEVIESVSLDLENYIHPIESSIPEGNKSELEALNDMIADAPIVGLGEATHGTLEFFQMKDRIFLGFSFEQSVSILRAVWEKFIDQ